MTFADGGVVPDTAGEPRSGQIATEWQVLNRLERAAIGRREAGGVTRVRRREPAGCLLYGPYWQLPAGAYRLSFRCRCGKPRFPSEPVLGVEVIALNRVQLAWCDLTAAELADERGSIDFSIPPALGLGAGDEARIEFRFSHLGNADLTITAVDLRGLGQQADGLPPTRQWRMLGRLKKTAIGARVRSCVAVHQTAPAGCVLDAGRPYLQLPEGHYRLSFHCRTGTPRMTSQPVLGVEVSAWNRWHNPRPGGWRSLLGTPPAPEVQLSWRDFTGAELEDGFASIDFAVPPELSLEAGEEIPFGFRFFHLANADLTIDAVDLRQLASSEAPVPPRQWRMLGRLVMGAVGRRQSDRVVVHQAEPAKPLLCGGRPDLRLPNGWYRLSVCCWPGPPRIASQPVLGVEVVARTRLFDPHDPARLLGAKASWKIRRDFTAEALQDGHGWIDFEVPAELSLEDGKGVRFEVNLIHLTNADLRITAVDLHETLQEEATGASSRPRSLPSRASKRSVVIIGNCQALTVHEALLRNRELNARLDVRYHFVGLQKNLHDHGKRELEKSHVLLVQDINDWQTYPLRSYIRSDLPIFKFPLLRFASLWPFDFYNGPGDKEAYEREWPNLTFLYLDGLLARLRKEIPEPEQRLLAYRSLEINGIINYVRMHDFEKRRLIAMDRQFGFGIGQFILENFQRKQLFYTTNHPNARVFGMLMEYVLKCLGIYQMYSSDPGLDHLRRLQVPVHPKVAKALGVRWADEKTKYVYSGEKITWESYTRRYIDHYG